MGKRIFNEQKTEELFDVDLENGTLLDDLLQIGMTEGISEVDEVGHYEVVKEYPNGGKDVEWVVTIPRVEELPSQPIFEEIFIYKPYVRSVISEEEKEENKFHAKMTALEQRLNELQLCLTYIATGGDISKFREVVNSVEELQAQYIKFFDELIEMRELMICG